ncbi:hypothetical protein [Fusobacterium periodonticum]|uniref:Uncharacterized protein n=1 Tax=Fusobacterium periodonticum 1_1_41FAA TaxID=469621 RepID=D6LG39_9FUSO|nr:hypothetical protein [Fusobacterium periodonticum]EFG29124.1 hypothetical protein HMPREF0400_00688 [Fusobacterium periodonticum 1_1_41FAA]
MVAYLCEQKQLKQIYFRSNLIRNEELCKLYSVDGRLKLDVVYTNPVKKEKGKVAGINTFDIETFNNNSMEVVGKYKNTENATDIKVTIVPNDQVGIEQQVNIGANSEKPQRYNVEVDPVVVAKDTKNVKLPSNELFSSVDYVVASKDSTIESKPEKPKRHSVRVMPIGARNTTKKEESIKVGAAQNNVEPVVEEKVNLQVETPVETTKTNNTTKDYRVIPEQPKVEKMQEEPIIEKEVVTSNTNVHYEEVSPKGQRKNSFLLPILFIGIGILLGGFLGLKSSFMFNAPKTVETAQNK